MCINKVQSTHVQKGCISIGPAAFLLGPLHFYWAHSFLMAPQFSRCPLEFFSLPVFVWPRRISDGPVWLLSVPAGTFCLSPAGFPLCRYFSPGHTPHIFAIRDRSLSAPSASPNPLFGGGCIKKFASGVHLSLQLWDHSQAVSEPPR